ncbi:MAG: response regulator, partial [Chloroflexi bacterium]|nr:response regulator [Chloroflexota bacterium]
AVADTVELFRTMRHELRTPINHIIGYSELLLEECEANSFADLTSDLHRIHESGKCLLAIVDEYLHPDTANFALSVEQLSHELRTPLNAIIGYSDMLIEESVDLGEPELRADLEKIHGAGEHLLGLVNAVLDLWKLRAGTVDLEATMPARAGLRAPAPRPLSPDRRGYLLVVDDNAINREMLSRRLRRLGYTVAIAADGHEALRRAQSEPFDLLLLDVLMPDLDGYAVLALWKADRRLRDIPVIMISALDELESVVRCIELGAEDYLPKPFDSVLLEARISASLEKKRLRDQEVEYLRQVGKLTTAAAEVESKSFDPESLSDVSLRSDQLGQLARVFQRMAVEVFAREERLQQEVEQLRIEIDQVKRVNQVTEITETDYFQELRRRSKELRSRAVGPVE